MGYIQGGDVTAPDQHAPDAVLQDLRRRMRDKLKDFEPPTEAFRSPGRSIAITLDRLPVPRLVQWAMTWALGAPDHGKDEKRAWLTTFEYKGIPCSLGLYKFGMRLFVGIDTDDADTLADEIVKRIDQAIRVAEGDILTDFAEAQMQAGNVTVQNQYGTFHGLYWHFRDRLPDAESPDEVDDAEHIDRLVRRMNAALARQSDHFYASVALVNAYFSLLEHLLVLLWPFVSYRPGVDDVESMIKSRWSDKFKTVFAVENDPDAKRVYDRLRNVAEEYRNTYAHGGFDKRRGALFVHFPGGAIPASLSESRRRIRTSFFPIAEPDVDEILSVLDETDEWFKSGPAAYGMMFAESGIDVPFDSDSLSDLQQRMTTLDDFENHLRGLSRWLDDQTNMDW